MMSWEFRVMKQKYHHPINNEDMYYYGIHEVFYNKDNTDFSYTADAVDVGGDSLEDIRWVLEAMLKALDKPVLDYGTDNGQSKMGNEVRNDENSSKGLE